MPPPPPTHTPRWRWCLCASFGCRSRRRKRRWALPIFRSTEENWYPFVRVPAALQVRCGLRHGGYPGAGQSRSGTAMGHGGVQSGRATGGDGPGRDTGGGARTEASRAPGPKRSTGRVGQGTGRRVKRGPTSPRIGARSPDSWAWCSRLRDGHGGRGWGGPPLWRLLCTCGAPLESISPHNRCAMRMCHALHIEPGQKPLQRVMVSTAQCAAPPLVPVFVDKSPKMAVESWNFGVWGL